MDQRPFFALALVGALSACSDVASTTSSGAGGSGGKSPTTGTSSASTSSAVSTTMSATSSSSSASSTSSASTTSTGMMLATVDFTSHLVELGTGNKVPAAKVCVFEHPELACATSDSMGAFTLAVPANADTGVLIDKMGYASVLVAFSTSSNPLTTSIIYLPTAASTQAFYAAAGTSYPNPGKGFLAVLSRLGNTTMGEAGSTFTITPASGVGPTYADASSMASLSLSATTSSGLARFGAVSPGTIQVDAVCHPGTPEANFYGWLTAIASQVKLPIVDGYETEVGFGCF